MLDLHTVEARARRAYEFSRLRRAALGATPLLLVAALAAALGSSPDSAIAPGAVLFLGGFACLWFGRGPQKSVLPGVLAGLVPLAMVVCAGKIGHHCTGATCRSLCLWASAVGGLGAGLAVGTWTVRRTAPAAMWVTASGVALVTGSMGCSCAGARGLVAMGLGFVVASALLVLGARFVEAKS
jgi:hypothetical protein